MKSQLIRNLNGYSGCVICLMNDGSEYTFIRKTSKDIAYNARLQKQKIKQEQFKSNFFRVPRVLRDGFDESNLYFFDMEFVIGMPLYQAMLTPSLNVSELFLQKLEGHFSSLDLSTRDCQSLFADKFHEIEKNTKFSELARAHSVLQESLFFLKNMNWNGFPTSSCHGDLTLENILVTQDKEIYLIDFLDSFVDSALIDCAKLLQDLELQWSLRHSPNKNQYTVDFVLLKSKLFKLNFVQIHTNEHQLYCLLLLNCLRIIPYIQEFEINFIVNAIAQIFSHLKKGDLR